MTRRSALLALVFAGILISYIDRGNLGIAAPALMSELHFTPASMGILLSAFFWTYATFQIPAGYLLDRFGIRWTYAGAFLLWSLASAAIAISRNWNDMLLLRMLLGIAETVGPIASLTFIRQNYSGKEQGFPTAIYIAGQTFGPAIGTLLGTTLLASHGWRFLFAATGLGALIWIPLWILIASSTGNRTGRELAPSSPARSNPFPWGACLAQPVFWALASCVFFLSYFWYFVLTWVPTYLVSAHGLSTLAMGRILATPLFAMAFVNMAAGFVADRLTARGQSILRVRTWFLAAGLLGASSLLLLNLIRDLHAVLPVLLLAICSFGVASSSFWTIAQYISPTAKVGRVIAILNTVSQIAGSLAPILTGWSLGPEKHFEIAIGFAGISPILAVLMLLFANPTRLGHLREHLAHGLDLAPRPSRFETA